MDVLPAWYVDMLLDGLRAEQSAQVLELGSDAEPPVVHVDTLAEWG